MKKAIILLFFFANTLCQISNGQIPYVYKTPTPSNDGWATKDLRKTAADMPLLHRFFNQLKTEKHRLHSMLVVKDGALVIEEYFDGHSITKTHDLRSVTKSIRALLLGIAIDKGFIEDVNDPISKYLRSPTPQKNRDPRKQNITLKHLITMSSGLDCNDWDQKSKGQEDKVYRKKDWLQYTVDLPMVNKPGDVSNYCSMGVVLLVEIIQQATGMPIDAFAQQYLFDPMGIANLAWGHTAKKEVITAGKRLYMTPRDMAKLGQLVLQKGRWNDQQLVSEEWIHEATRPQTKITDLDYGYLWWNIPFFDGQQKVIGKVATGNGGQYIMVFPELQIVAVFTGGAYNSQDDKLPFAVMNRIVLPTLKTKP